LSKSKRNKDLEGCGCSVVVHCFSPWWSKGEKVIVVVVVVVAITVMKRFLYLKL
jgi:hypothetical protein